MSGCIQKQGFRLHSEIAAKDNPQDAAADNLPGGRLVLFFRRAARDFSSSEEDRKKFEVILFIQGSRPNLHLAERNLPAVLDIPASELICHFKPPVVTGDNTVRMLTGSERHAV